jgi:hypothetical protein
LRAKLGRATNQCPKLLDVTQALVLPARGEIGIARQSEDLQTMLLVDATYTPARIIVEIDPLSRPAGATFRLALNWTP